MASIEDLKTTTEYTGAGTASGTDDGVMSFGSINKTRMDLGSVNTTKHVQSADSVDEDEFTPKKRTIADLSSLPKRELQGVDLKESIESEVFKEGGDFESARTRKIQEMMEINALIDAHNAEVAANLGIDVPSDEELQEIGQIDMTPALIGTKYYDQADNYGRAKGSIKTSPLEEKAKAEGKTIDQYISGQDISPTTTVLNEEGEKVNVEISTDGPTNMNFEDEDEYMDEMEKELNQEFENTVTENVRVISTSDKPTFLDEDEKVEEIVTDENNSDEEEVVEEITEEDEVIGEKITPELKKEEKKEEEVAPKIEVAKPKEKEETVYDTVANTAKSANVGVNVDFNIDQDDIDDLGLDAEESAGNTIEEVDRDANMKEFQASVTEKIKPVNKALNLSSFTILNKPVTLSPAMMNSEKVAMSWALPNSGQYIAMTEFSGKEIEQLGDTSGTNRFQTMKNIYQLFYNHIVSPKPDSLEAWLKTVSFLDNDHLYFAVYGANFSGSNFIAYDCPECKSTFLSDNIPLEDMYKFKDDETKAKFIKIKDSQQSLPNGLYVSEVVQISDKFAIGFRDPSIYNIVFETALLDEKFLEKYRDLTAVISYIDNIYLIDPVNGTLAPIDYKVYVGNDVKTIKSRIITYARILNTLAPDQYYVILSYLNAINSRTEEITYIKPEVTCPDCHSTIEEATVTAESLVFTRAQLASLTLTSIN